MALATTSIRAPIPTGESTVPPLYRISPEFSGNAAKFLPQRTQRATGEDRTFER